MYRANVRDICVLPAIVIDVDEPRSEADVGPVNGSEAGRGRLVVEQFLAEIYASSRVERRAKSAV